MKNILIYFPYNHRTVEQQSVMELLVKKGHNVFLLTLTPENYLHKYVRELGIKAFASPVTTASKIKSIFANAKYLVSFCKKNEIDIIIAHQQLAALPLIFAKPFLKKTKLFYVRHNADEDYQSHPVKATMINGFINRMLPSIVAPSDVVYEYMTKTEKVPVRKMQRINYGYNFSQYDKPNLAVAAQIRDEHSCKLLLISIARLFPAKRHSIMFAAVKALKEKGLNVKMICLGDGVIKEELADWVSKNQLQDTIYFKGIRSNIFDYLVAGDVLFHLSSTEASNSVVKEAGLVKRSVIVCEQVGDFSDYIQEGYNGFLLDKNDPLQQAIALLEKAYYDKGILVEAGERLHETILKEFSIENVSSKYDALVNDQSR